MSLATPPVGRRERNKQQKLDRKLMTWEQRERFAQSDQIPGAILRTKVDVTHPLGFGVRCQCDAAFHADGGWIAAGSDGTLVDQ